MSSKKESENTKIKQKKLKIVKQSTLLNFCSSPKKNLVQTPVSKRTRSKLKEKQVINSPKITKWIVTDLKKEVERETDNFKKPIVKKLKRNNSDVELPPLKIKKQSSRDEGASMSKSNLQDDYNKKENSNNNVLDSPEKIYTVRSYTHKPRNSFIKYGVHLPSFDDIIQDQEDLQAYSKKVDEICDIIEKDKPSLTVIEKHDVKTKLPILGCEHLTSHEIKKYFKKYKDYCLGIIEGRIDSNRHEKYLKKKSKGLGMDSLTYNTSMITFSSEQKNVLARLCNRYFYDCDIYNHNQYYFQVLLPELCLKIFMDVHKLDYKEAIDYLDKRPVEDII